MPQHDYPPADFEERIRLHQLHRPIVTRDFTPREVEYLRDYMAPVRLEVEHKRNPDGLLGNVGRGEMIATATILFLLTLALAVL